MFLRSRVLLLASFLLVTLGAWVGAQVYSRTPVDPPIVLSGSDVGFQITARDGTTPVGTLVVRIDGKWVPVKDAPATSRLTRQ
jgi:hypothetical protein